MRALAFTPRWVGGLLFCLTAAVVCALLGRWQWDVAQHGTLQNTAYAFNWWLFSLLFVGFWFKALRDTARRDTLARGVDGGATGSRAVPVAPVSFGLSGPAERLPRFREPAPEISRPPLPTAEEDPDVAAWNDWLTELNADPKR